MTGRAANWAMGAVLAVAAFGAGAQTAAIDAADGELLEFLGSWEAEDGDWIAVTIEDLHEEQRTGVGDDGDEARAGADDDEK